MTDTPTDYIYDFEIFFDLTPDLLCIAGYDGYFRRVNAAVINTLGYSKEELLQRPIETFVYPQDRKSTTQSRNTVIQNKPLLNFENRYVSKKGEIVWLTWTSMGIPSQKLVFGIAKDITYRKKLEEYRKISMVLNDLGTKKDQPTKKNTYIPSVAHSPANQWWILKFESLVRASIGKEEINLRTLSYEMALSERQVFRRIKNLLGVTPNHFIQVIRMQVAMVAIKSGNYRTISEISKLAGFETSHHFKKVFKKIYDVDVGDIL